MKDRRAKRADFKPKKLLGHLLGETENQPNDSGSRITDALIVGRVGVVYQPGSDGASFGLTQGFLDPLPHEIAAGGEAVFLSATALDRQAPANVARYAAILAEASRQNRALNCFLIAFPFSATGAISTAAGDCLDELFVVMGTDALGPDRWAGRVRSPSTPVFELAYWHQPDRLAHGPGLGLVCRVRPVARPAQTRLPVPALRSETSGGNPAQTLSEAVRSHVQTLANPATRPNAIEELSTALTALLAEVDSLPDQARLSIARNCRELLHRLAEVDRPSPEQRTLTARQAARLLGKSQQLLGVLARRGQIGEMVGRKYLFSMAEVERLKHNPPQRGRPKS